MASKDAGNMASNIVETHTADFEHIEAEEDDKHVHIESEIYIQKGKVQEKLATKDQGMTESKFDLLMKQLDELTIQPDRSDEYLKSYVEQFQSFYRLEKIIKVHLSIDWSELEGCNEKLAQQFITSFSPKLFKVAESIQQVFDEWITSNHPPPTDVVVKQSGWCVEYIEKLDNLRSVCREIAGARFCSTYLPLQGQSLFKTYATSSHESLSESPGVEEGDKYSHKKFGNKSKNEGDDSVVETGHIDAADTRMRLNSSDEKDSDQKLKSLPSQEINQHAGSSDNVNYITEDKTSKREDLSSSNLNSDNENIERQNVRVPILYDKRKPPGTCNNVNQINELKSNYNHSGNENTTLPLQKDKEINRPGDGQSNQLIQALISALSQISNTQQSSSTPNHGAAQPPVVMAAPITMEPLSIPDFPGVMEEYHNWKDYVVTTMDEMRLSYSLRTKYIWSKLDKETKRRLQHIDINSKESHSLLWKELDLMFDRKELLKTHCVSRLLELATWKEASSIIQVRALHDYVVEYINKLRKATGDAKDGNSYNQLLYKLCPNHVKNILESEGDGSIDSTLMAMRKHLEREENKANKSGINPYKGKANKQIYSVTMSHNDNEDLREAEKLLSVKQEIYHDGNNGNKLWTYALEKHNVQKSPPDPRKQSNQVHKSVQKKSNQVYLPSAKGHSEIEISEVSVSEYKIPPSCIFCSKQHSPHKCNKYNQAGKFWDHVYKERSCRNCLDPEHQVEKCPYARFCNCDQQDVPKHSPLLHNYSRGAKLIISTSILNNSIRLNRTPRLQTIKMKMRKSGDDHWILGRGFLDTGSMINLAPNKLTKVMNLDTQAIERVNLKSWGGNEIEVDARWMEMELAPIKARIGMKIQVLSVPQSNGTIKGSELSQSQQVSIQENEMDLSDPETTTDGEFPVDILLGIGLFYKLLSFTSDIIFLPGDLIAVNSPFGYVLAGGGMMEEINTVKSLAVNRISLGITSQQFPLVDKEIGDMDYDAVTKNHENKKVNDYSSTNVAVNQVSLENVNSEFISDEFVQGVLEQFVGVEIGEIAEEKEEISPIVKEFEAKVIFANNRTEAPFPWILRKKRKLDPHFGLCFTRCNSAYRRRSRKGNEELQQIVNSYLDEQIKDNIITKVADIGKVEDIQDTLKLQPNAYNNIEVSDERRTHYMPYQEVYKASTGKFRLVYDASAKNHKWDWSLNECLEKGPLLTNHIFKILLGFRKEDIAIIADIEKAFLQVGVKPEDSDMLRFIWRHEDTISIYKFLRLPFGLRCSPFILAATIKTYVDQANIPQEVKDKILSSFYVDDLTTSFETEEAALQFIRKIREILNEIGMPLRKFNSNNINVCKTLEQLDGEEKNKEEKVLGMTWKTDSDTISINSTRILQHLDEDCTKTDVLSIMARLFDPLHMLAPFVFLAKEILREACESKLTWKQQLPNELKERWRKWKKELYNLVLIEVPRKLIVNNANLIKLEGYCDASSRGYAAVIYVTSENEEKDHDSNYVISKTKLKPVVSQTIPRMELMGAVLLVKLMTVVMQWLKNWKIDDVSYYSDSKAALGWIKSYHLSHPPFVANRIKTVNMLSDRRKWNFIPSASNPADIPTRGSLLRELSANQLWWKGPDTSSILEEDHSILDVNETEENNVFSLNTNIVQITEVEGIGNLIPNSVTRNYHHLMRKTQLILKAIRRMRKNEDRAERSDAEKLWFQYIQRKHYQEEIEFCSKPTNERKKKIPPRVRWLRLYYDPEDGFLKLNTRTLYREMGVPPLLLPYESDFTRMFVHSQHLRLGHGGVRAVLTDLRSHVWIPRARKLVSSVINNCRACRLVNARPFKLPESPPLPECRVKMVRPFDTIGLDYAGPIELKSGEGYSLIITCAVTRGVHIQSVKSLSKKDFIYALTKYMCRKGIPSLIISDNAKTFKSAALSLKELCEDPKVKEYLDKRRVSWKFYTDRSPWKGGFIERIVGLFKSVLKKVVGKARINHEDFDILNHEAEMFINSRPLVYVYDNPEDGDPLTPSKLINGYNITDLPPFKNVNWNLKTPSLTSRLKLLNNLRLNLWKCLQKEYLSELTERHLRIQPTGQVRKPKVDEVVLIKGEKLVPRMKWQLGRVMKVCKDGRNGRISAIKLQPVDRQHGHVNLKSCDLTEPIWRSVNCVVPLEGDLPYYLDEKQ